MMFQKTLLIIGLVVVMILLNVNAYLIAFYEDAAYPTAGMYHLAVIFFAASLVLLFVQTKLFHPINAYQDHESVDVSSMIKADLGGYVMIGYHGILWLSLIVLGAMTPWLLISGVFWILLWLFLSHATRYPKTQRIRLCLTYFSHFSLVISLSIYTLMIYFSW